MAKAADGQQRRWWWTLSIFVLSCLSSPSSLRCESGGVGPHQDSPQRAFQSQGGSISSPNLLCSSVHLRLSHWSPTPTHSHAQKRAPEVVNVMRKRLSSSLAFAGVLSPLSTKQVIVPRWLQETPLISVSLCLRWLRGHCFEQDNYFPFIHYNDLNYSSGISYLVRLTSSVTRSIGMRSIMSLKHTVCHMNSY